VKHLTSHGQDTPSKPDWIIRCDATRETGLGHLSRCLGVAEGLGAANETSVFVGHYDPDFLTLISAAGFAGREWGPETGRPEDAGELALLAADLGTKRLVADDYRIDVGWLSALGNHGLRPVLIDDFARLPTYESCQGVVNFTVGSPRLTYPNIPEDRVLRGPEYFPARRALAGVRAARARRASEGGVHNLLVTIGGGDPNGVTWRVLAAISELAPTARVRALVLPALRESREAEPFKRWLVPTTPSMAEHYLWADACVSGGGLSKYECAYLGLPVGILSQTHDQQAETGVFVDNGLGFDLGGVGTLEESRLRATLRSFLLDRELHGTLARRGLRLFPPDGAQRLAQRTRSWND